jgi:anti-sigma B factor antagonist
MFDVEIGANGHVSLVGRLDASQADQAQKVLRDLTGPLVADCSRLDYVSSAGISVLLEVHRRLSGRGEVFRLVGMSPRVKTVFLYTGLDKVLAIE